MAQTVEIEVAGARLAGELKIPRGAEGAVLFVHAGGDGRRSGRDRLIAARLRAARLATLRVDLFGGGAGADDEVLARRVATTIDWLSAGAPSLPIGLAASGKGAAIALRAAAIRSDRIGAIVVRGGRPDLAGDALERVVAPTLLMVGGRDAAVVGLNRRALARLGGPKRIVVAPASGQAFEGPGRLDFVARLAATWFRGWLAQEAEAPRAAEGGI